MKVALLGYGKMGRMIDSLAEEFNAAIVARVDDPRSPLPDDFDVAIDFTQPDSVLHNVQRVSERRKAIVIGTTGWAADAPRIKEVVAAAGIGCVHSSNFSVGVNIFYKILAEAGRLFSERPEYEAWAYEIHHSAKKDAPSGTLLHAVERIRAAGYGLPIDVASNRAGKIPGTHTIGFDSAADTITFQHVARNREGFARGALVAAQLVVERPGFWAFDELL